MRRLFFWNTFPSFASGPGNFLFDLAIGDGSLPRAPGSVVDNEDTVYQFDAGPALTPEEQVLNDLIFRIGAEPQTRRKHGLVEVPTITGNIDIPVLTLHNLGDLFVPVLNLDASSCSEDQFREECRCHYIETLRSLDSIDCAHGFSGFYRQRRLI